MSNRVPIDSPLAGPIRERAADAWRRLNGERPPLESVEILQIRRKSAICRFGPGGTGAEVIAKQCPPETARIEHAIYGQLLASSMLPTLRCYGMVPEPEGDRCWIFLEDAGGEEYTAALAEHRALAGRWLATLHRGLEATRLKDFLPARDPAYYHRLLRSARATIETWSRNPVVLPEDAALLRTLVMRCQVLDSHWSELAGFCERLPAALVHGDLAQKNLRVQRRAGGPALMVFDWELAGWGVPATDLAQSVGRCASPDLNVYCSVLGRDRQPLDARDIRKLADYGVMLRILDKMFWETLCLMGDSYRFLSKPLLTLRKYDSQLAAALRALHWDTDD